MTFLSKTSFWAALLVIVGGAVGLYQLKQWPGTMVTRTPASSPAAVGSVQCGVWHGDVLGVSGEPATEANIVVGQCADNAIFTSCTSAQATIRDDKGGSSEYSVQAREGVCMTTFRNPNGSGSQCLWTAEQIAQAQKVLSERSEIKTAFPAFVFISLFSLEPDFKCSSDSPAGCPACSPLLPFN